MTSGDKSLLACLLLAFVTHAHAELDLRPVAMTGEDAPGVSNHVFVDFGTPVVADAGHVAFYASVRNGSGSSVRDGIWVLTPEGLRRLVAERMAAPGSGGVRFRFFNWNHLAINAKGVVAFGALVTGGSPSASYWVGTPGALESVGPRMRSLSSTTGQPPLVLNDSGRVAAPLTTNSTADVTLWTGTGGGAWTTVTVARGATGPLLTDGGTLAWMTPAYPAQLGYGPSASPSIVLDTGDAMPGLSGGALQSITRLALNRRGRVALLAIAGGGDRGLWIGPPDNLRLALRSSAQLKVGGASYSVFNPTLLDFNDADQALVRVDLSTQTETFTVVAVTDGETFRIVHRPGQPAPGTSLVFKDDRPAATLNNAGHVLIRAGVATTESGATRDTGLWHVAPDGRITLLLLTGRPLDIDPTAGRRRRTLESIALRTGYSRGGGAGHVWTDDGRFALFLGFTDGTSGIFTAHHPIFPDTHRVPGRIQAEDFRAVTSGYRDTTAGNRGRAYRLDEGVDISPTTDGGFGYAVTSTAPGEWLKYRVDVADAGAYNLRVRYTCRTESALRLRLDSTTLGTLRLPAAPRWKTRTFRVTLPAGTATLRVQITDGEPSLNYLDLRAAE